MAARVAFCIKPKLPRLRELVGRKNGFSTPEGRFDELEEFAAEISRDRNFGNAIALLCVAPVDLEPENNVRALRDSCRELRT
jgi:hypothetical protein